MIRAFFAIVVPATLAVLAGIWLGRSAAPAGPQPPSPHPVRVGPAHVVVPGGWSAASLRSAGVADLAAGSAVAFETTPGMSEWAVMLFSPTVEPSLIPAELRREMHGPVPEPALTRLAGLPAWSFLGLATGRSGMRADVTVLPTTGGVLAVVCTNRVAATDGTPCPDDIESLTVQGERPLVPSRSLALQQALPAVLDDLNRERLEHRARLSSARTPEAQALAAGRLGAKHRAAARAIDAAAGPAGAPLVRDLEAVASTYDALKEQAQAESAAGFATARAAVEDAETVLAADVRGGSRPEVASVRATTAAAAPAPPSDPASGVTPLVFAVLVLLATAAGVATGSSGVASRLSRLSGTAGWR
jgi:hypothetical protein